MTTTPPPPPYFQEGTKTKEGAAASAALCGARCACRTWPPRAGSALGRSRAALLALERNTLDATALRPHSGPCKPAARRHQTLARVLQRRGPLLCCVDRRRHCSLLGTGTKSPSGAPPPPLRRRRTLYYTTTADFDRLMVATHTGLQRQACELHSP